jgi:hypothetical protein
MQLVGALVELLHLEETLEACSVVVLAEEVVKASGEDLEVDCAYLGVGHSAAHELVT